MFKYRKTPKTAVSFLRKISLTTEQRRKLAEKSTKSGGLLMSTLPLAACISAGGSGGDAAPQSAGTLALANFTEAGANKYNAVDDNDSVFLAEGMTEDYTVIGGAGDDTITTSDGNDMIRGGEGVDTINAGAGDDAIVIIGTTTAGQYTQDAITNSAGSGTDLSSLISLADLNGRTVSEVSPGEVINGGSGTNTLFIYGTVDLTGVTLTKVDVLVVNSNVTLTPEQIAQFTTIDGDGHSVLNIEVPEGAEGVTLDLTQYDIHDVGTLNISGDITIIIDDISDIAEIESITVADLSQITLEIQAGDDGTTQINLGDLSAIFERINVIDAEGEVIVEIDDGSDIDELELEKIEGEGDIDDQSEGSAGEKLEEIDHTHCEEGDVPYIEKVKFDIIKGDTITITDDHIRTCAPEENDDVVTFYVIEAVHGEFRVDGVATTEFTQDHIDEGLVTFTHDGSDGQPDFALGLLYFDGETLHEGNVVEDHVYMGDFIRDGDYHYVTKDGADRVLNKAEYEGKLYVTGADGNDSITTGWGNDRVDGAGGNDIISTGGGHDRILYGAGDTVDGGTGFDTLVIEEDNLQLDLATLDVSNIEMIDMGVETDISFTVQDVLDISGENQDLVIWGDASGGVTSTGQGWDFQGQEEWEGQIMDVYLFGDAMLLVDSDITQNIN